METTIYTYLDINHFLIEAGITVTICAVLSFVGGIFFMIKIRKMLCNTQLGNKFNGLSSLVTTSLPLTFILGGVVFGGLVLMYSTMTAHPELGFSEIVNSIEDRFGIIGDLMNYIYAGSSKSVTIEPVFYHICLSYLSVVSIMVLLGKCSGRNLNVKEVKPSSSYVLGK